MLKIVLCLIAMQITQQSCVKGCLKCEDNTDKSAKICSVCDQDSKYVSDDKNTGCVVSTVENCKIFGKKDCLACEANYILDTKKCVKITTLIDNCAAYTSQTTCATCNEKAVISSGKCTLITSALIANCMTYSNQTTCSSCKVGFELVDNKCKAPVQLDNCIGYTNFECISCKPDHIYNPNLQVEVNSSSLYEILRSNAGTWSSISSETLVLNLDRCQEIGNFNTSNCLVFESFDKCKTCKPSFILTTAKLCIANPIDRIDNCGDYEDINTCKACLQNFFLNSKSTNNNKCNPIVNKIENCVEYSTVDTTVKCLKCSVSSKTHYLTGNSCTKRNTDPIVKAPINVNHYLTNGFCTTFDPKADKCLLCKSGRSLTDNGIDCYASISNCIKYDNSGNCTECKRETHYLNSSASDRKDQCVTGDTSTNKCATFQKTVNQCETCQKSFYGTCDANQKHDNIDNCDTYSNDDKWKCLKCKDNFVVFNFQNYCQDEWQNISECSGYTAQGVCSSCNSGFYLKTSVTPTTCVSFGNNCVEGTENTTDTNVAFDCSKCKDNFSLNRNKECKSTYNFISEYCAADKLTINNSDNNANTCSVCGDNSFTIDLNDTHVCVNEADHAKSITGLDTYTTIPNCMAYDYDDTVTPKTYKCARCADNLYLNNAKDGCVSVCPGAASSEQVGYSAFEVDSGVFKHNKHCMATTAADQDLVKGPAVKDGQAGIVLKCAKKAFTVLDAAFIAPTPFYKAGGVVIPEYSNVDPDSDGSTTMFIKHPKDVHPKVSCTKQTTITKVNGVTYTQAVNADSFNCHLWSLDGTEANCMRCPWGRIPNGDETDDTAPGEGKFIKCRTTQSSDFSTTRLFNIPPIWSYYFSVHKCVDSSNLKVPVLAMNMDNIKFESWKKIHIKTGNWTPAANSTTFSDPLFCVDLSSVSAIKTKSALTFAAVVAPATDPVVDMQGCGLAVLNTKQATDALFNNDQWKVDGTAEAGRVLQCAACKNGWFPTVNANSQFNSGCTEIKKDTNKTCDDSASSLLLGEMFNGCFKCIANHTHGWTSSKVDYTQCLAGVITNCAAIELVSTKNVCRMCNKGYDLNKDDLCIKITTPKCPDRFNMKMTAAVINATDQAYTLYRNQQGTGCSKCGDTSFKGFSINKLTSTPQQVCALNTTFATAQTTAFATTSVYIDYCRNYSNETAIKCKKCYDDDDANGSRKVLNNTDTKCISTGIQNCAVSIADNKCQKCQEGPNFLKNELCVNDPSGAIDFCSNYKVSTSNLTKPECETCNEGYYLDNKKCVKGTIPQCKVYKTDSETCTKCNDTFHLFSSTGEADYCIAATSNKCKEFDFSAENKVTCKTCLPHQTKNPSSSVFNSEKKATLKVFQSTDLVRPLNECHSFSAIEQCKSYTKTTVLGDPFKCTMCEDKFFLESQYVCKARTTINSCKVFPTDSDACSECNSGFFVDSTGKKCVANPNGILGCSVYSNSTTCTACNSTRYLTSTGKCELADVVDNCAEYSNKTTCKTCISTHFFEDKTVSGVTTKVCTKGPDNCSVIQSATVCGQCVSGYFLKSSKCEPNGISNCLKYSEDSSGNNKKCDQCENKRYFNGTQCILDAGQNCDEFVSKEVCKTCINDFTLGLTGKCASKGTQYDSNCSISKVPSNLVCSYCKPGMMFNSTTNACEAISNYQTGCLFAKITDGSCMMCTPGYYMNTSFSCINNVTNEPGPKPDSIGLFKAALAVLSLLYI